MKVPTLIPRWFRPHEQKSIVLSSTRARSLNCDHRGSIVRPENSIGTAWCPSCAHEVPLHEVFNTLLNLMRQTVASGPKGSLKVHSEHSKAHNGHPGTTKPTTALAGPKGRLPG